MTAAGESAQQAVETHSPRGKRFDPARARRDFPILQNTDLVFLDSAASAQKPQCVIDAIADCYSRDYANIHRGVYELSARATANFEATRKTVQRFIGAPEDREIIFVRSTTEAINLVAATYGRQNVGPGDEVLITEMEHHSNIVPWQMLCQEKGATLKVAPINDAGEVIPEAYASLLGPKTRLVAMVHQSNSLGTINPVKKMIEMAHAVGAVTLVDGAQAVAHRKVDVRDLATDFYVISGHKVYGPTGIGALYGRSELLDAMPPWQGGGDMILSVTFERTTYNELPFKFEAGTPHIAGAIAMGAAIDYVTDIGLENIAAHEHDLLEYATRSLREINSVRLIGTARDKAAIVSFELDGIHPHDVGTILDREGVAVRTGHHCAQPVMDRFDVAATVRASFGLYNTRDEVDALVASLRHVQEIFGP